MNAHHVYMHMYRVRTGGLALVALVAIVLAGCSDKIGRGWDWNRMRAQPKYQAYGASKFFPNGMAMRVPPAGTVAREAVAASWPVPPDPAVVASGAHIFRVYCAVCHGESANGRSIVASNMVGFRPPSLLTEAVRARADSSIYTIVTDGLGHMPAFSGTLSMRERQEVAVYVGHLARSAPVGVDSTQQLP